MTRGRYVLTGMLVLAATGCTTYRVETRPLPQVLETEQPRVVRVTMADDRIVELYQPTVLADSLRGHLTATSVRRLSYPLLSVRSASFRRFHLGRTVLMVLAVGGGVLAYDLLMGLNNTP
ncbi:MAG TPA: hypothetical protein VMK53_00110 [Gemmatimonadales bacterium]|nr:hypothetical protein [Gemmatimonadales bacterium]